MAKAEKPASVLARQGQEADELQNMRLKMAQDPVYAHLATLSTAATINGIRWEVDEGRKGRTKLVAVRQEGKRETRRPGQPDAHSASWTLDGGVKLTGKLSFGGVSLNRDKRAFPYAIDASLTNNQDASRNFPRQLLSSEVMLVREPSEVYGVAAMRVGIVATHASGYSLEEAKLEAVNETPGPEDFRAVIGLIEKTIKPEEADEEGESRVSLLLATRRQPTTEIVTAPETHFGFHEALGVPAGYIERARGNFATLVGYMGLPYELTPPEPPQPAA